jgi:putative heme-binding domain-containing protein
VVAPKSFNPGYRNRHQTCQPPENFFCQAVGLSCKFVNNNDSFKLRELLMETKMRRVVCVLLAVIAVGNYSADLLAQSTPADKIKTLDGFKIDLVYSVPQEQGSWVSLTHDPQGRLIASDQYGRLYRIDASSKDTDKVQVEPIDIPIGRAQGLLCAFDSLYVDAHKGGNQPAGLFRIRDTNNDDKYDQVQLLRAFQGGGEHGPHAVILSPDKKSLYVCAGNHTKIPNPELSRVPRNWQEDQLLPSMPDANGHAAGIKAPGGWIAKTDPAGRRFELISSGFRNEYDIAFSPEGELFTYDADMEWDIGTPWYRPTRVCHVSSGSEFGWRTGSGKWPADYPDSLPAILDIGPGSPTGIVFGTGAKFPEKYQRALYICDWSYGLVYAVHLKADGASYRAEKEVLCSAPALQAADITVNPVDGALYFVIGGRKTQSGLYRVTYGGSESTDPAKPLPLNELAKTRKKIEALHSLRGPKVVNEAWPYLDHPDRFIRFAARIAIEQQDPRLWQQRALKERLSQARTQAIIALARKNNRGLQAAALRSLGAIPWDQISDEQKIDLLRAYGLVLIRMGGANANARKIINEKIGPHYPSKSSRINQELCRLLIATGHPDVVEITLNLLVQAPTQEEQLHYVHSLSVLQTGWSLEQRERYYQWFLDAANFYGGRSFNGFLQNIRKRSLATIDPATKNQLKEILDRKPTVKDPYAELKSRPFVKKWEVADLATPLKDELKNRDFENGRKMFGVAQCYKCHRFADQGGIVGPDLTVVGRRFNKRDLLETIVDPNKSISDQYQATEFELVDGRVITGRVVNLSGNSYMVQPDMMTPNKLVNINTNDIEEQRPSSVSTMPAGLLDNLTKDEILDLFAYLRSGGKRDFAELKQTAKD